MPEMKVEIDKMRCQQIFINLISNAIKFSKPYDKIRISVEQPILLDDNKWQFVFRVTDQGMGLNETDRKNLFQPHF